MLTRNSNWRLAVGLAIGAAIGLAAAGVLAGRPALAQSDSGKPVGLAIFKDPDELGSKAYAYILYDSGKVDRKLLKAVAGGN